MSKLKARNIEEQIENAFSFNIDYKKGLTKDQVERRIREGLVNKQKNKVTKSYAKIILDNLVNPLNVLLISIFIFMLIGNMSVTSYFFMVILFFNIAVGIYQDVKARILISKLSVISDPKTKVLRDGSEVELDNSKLVYEDIIFLNNGDQVPTDCLILEGTCAANESMLTGESEPINKTPKDSLLSGSYLVSGNVKAIVKKIGAANYAEKLHEKAVAFKRPNSEIKKAINAIVYICIACVVFFAIAAILLNHYTVGLFNWDVYPEFISKTSGSLISMIPSGMYLLTSITLTVGVVALARKRMLVQQLYCIEMLARVDLVCFDKTGTLTDGDMKVEDLIPVSGESKENIEDLLGILVTSINDKNATSEALKKYLKLKKKDKAARIIPFNSATKYSAVEFKDGSTLAIGAFGFVNAKSDKKTEELVVAKSQEGYRVLCVYRNKKSFTNNGMPELSTIIGLILITNSVKKDAYENIQWFQNNNVTVKIISGDNALTVSHIAKICGVNNYDNYLNCENISDEDLVKLAEQKTVFGRVTPEQKELLIKTFKENKHTVAMTGDGVNDILALKVADCSIAMASGSSAAKNVAHIVSIDNDFSKLPNVVEEGRRVINNLQRSCSLFLSKTIFAVLLTLIFDLLFYFTKENYPFETNNMFIWEVLTIGMASFLLALQPTKDRLTGSFAKNIFLKAIPSGIAEVTTVILSILLTIQMPEMFVILSVLSFTLMSLIVLFKICLPLDRYRFFVFIFTSVLALGVMCFDKYNSFIDLLHLDWNAIDARAIVLIIIILFISTVVYLILDYVIGKKLSKTNAESIK